MTPLPLPTAAAVLARRPPRNAVSADRPYAFLVEPERAAGGRLVDVATLFLTNRECPFRCVMCDLWKNTLTRSVAPGQIPEQIRWALAQLPPAHHLKLYNAGSFFDAQAIPPADDAAVAALAAPFERVIVECHPKLVGRRCWAFRDRLGPVQLEVAMGLETVHPDVLPRLNKGMTLADFSRAAGALRAGGVAVRAFILVRPPFLSDAGGVAWAMRSLDFAFAQGVACCSLLPTRGGNGMMEELAAAGHFAPPSLDALEAVMEYGLNLNAGRVFLDLWDIDKAIPAAPDRAARVARLARMNRSQTVEGAVTRFDCDLAILGSGFGGSLLATVARTLGYSVALLERGTHPRFAIGESSTPLADFKLARIADRFNLPWLRPLAKYGPWKAAYPHLPVGLKRGFSFFRHQNGERFAAGADNENALIVAASPDDSTADTHWFRADFDAHLVERAKAAGAAYLDECEVHTVRRGAGWEIDGTRPDGAVSVRAGLLVDATGGGQALGRALGLEAVDPRELRARSRGLYSHFTGVARWHDVLEEEGGPAATAGHPFPCDAAALHQVIDHGWMWVLRFETGVTSAGFSLDPEFHPVRPGETPEEEWQRLLAAHPSLARQFRDAVPVRPLTRTGRLQRRVTTAAGPDWALLPHAAGFLDAWLSPGIAQTLYAVNRLANILADETPGPGRARRLGDYGRTLLRELAWVDEITGTCFGCFDRFPVMGTAAMIYFTAAIVCEERERRGEAGPDDGFLLADHPEYRAVAAGLLADARTATDAGAFLATARRRLGPYNACGLCDPARKNLYPYLPAP